MSPLKQAAPISIQALIQETKLCEQLDWAIDLMQVVQEHFWTTFLFNQR